MKKFTNKIAIIGFGNMGKAIVSGLIKSGNFEKSNFLVSNDGVSNIKAVKEAEVIILAVRPEMVLDVLDGIKDHLSKEKVLISLVARLKIDDIKNFLGFKYSIVRVMPNICASVGESMSCWVKSREVSVSQIKKVKFILRSIGEEIMLSDEKLFNVVTVISGSGPAYFLYLAELFFDFAEKMKLEPKLARRLIEQTFLGTSSMLFEVDKSARTLRREITSKGGTTESVFKKLHEEKFGQVFLEALISGYKKTSGNTPEN
ncbi:MAG: pyrroline-5-carboxylate reductase [Ignavibacteriaceae bacterium]|nr:pyrroline-5-carboxylate reductase [Ignavibacteriaceae bacterium]